MKTFKISSFKKVKHEAITHFPGRPSYKPFCAKQVKNENRALCVGLRLGRTIRTEGSVGLRHKRPLPQEVIQARPMAHQRVIRGQEPLNRKQEAESRIA